MTNKFESLTNENSEPKIEEESKNLNISNVVPFN